MADDELSYEEKGTRDAEECLPVLPLACKTSRQKAHKVCLSWPLTCTLRRRESSFSRCFFYSRSGPPPRPSLHPDYFLNKKRRGELGGGEGRGGYKGRSITFCCSPVHWQCHPSREPQTHKRARKNGADYWFDVSLNLGEGSREAASPSLSKTGNGRVRRAGKVGMRRWTARDSRTQVHRVGTAAGS